MRARTHTEFACTNYTIPLLRPIRAQTLTKCLSRSSLSVITSSSFCFKSGNPWSGCRQYEHDSLWSTSGTLKRKTATAVGAELQQSSKARKAAGVGGTYLLQRSRLQRNYASRAITGRQRQPPQSDILPWDMSDMSESAKYNLGVIYHSVYLSIMLFHLRSSHHVHSFPCWQYSVLHKTPVQKAMSDYVTAVSWRHHQANGNRKVQFYRWPYNISWHDDTWWCHQTTPKHNGMRCTCYSRVVSAVASC